MHAARNWSMVLACCRNRRAPTGGNLAGKVAGICKKRQVLVGRRMHSLMAQGIE